MINCLKFRILVLERFVLQGLDTLPLLVFNRMIECIKTIIYLLHIYFTKWLILRVHLFNKKNVTKNERNSILQ